MFNCKTAGLRSLLTVCHDRGTSPGPEKGAISRPWLNIGVRSCPSRLAGSVSV